MIDGEDEYNMVTSGKSHTNDYINGCDVGGESWALVVRSADSKSTYRLTSHCEFCVFIFVFAWNNVGEG